jgi:pyruvate-formate lyase-activating enzyme
MTTQERMKAWENLSEPKPNWETFKRMMAQFNNNPLVVRTLWIKKNSQSKVTISQ